MLKLKLEDHNPHCGAALTHHIVKASINSPSPINFEAHAIVKTDHLGKFIKFESFELGEIETSHYKIDPSQFEGFLGSINTSVEEVEALMKAEFAQDMNWDLPSNQSAKMNTKQSDMPGDDEILDFISSIFGVGVSKKPGFKGSGSDMVNDLISSLTGKR